MNHPLPYSPGGGRVEVEVFKLAGSVPPPREFDTAQLKRRQTVRVTIDCEVNGIAEVEKDNKDFGSYTERAYALKALAVEEIRIVREPGQIAGQQTFADITEEAARRINDGEVDFGDDVRVTATAGVSEDQS